MTRNTSPEFVVGGKSGFSFEKLDFDNYKDWEFNVTMLLRKEGVWNVFQAEVSWLEEERDHTSEDEEVSEYKYSDSLEEKAEKALSIICMSVGKAQRVHVRGIDTPGAAWLALKYAFKNKGSEDPTVLKMKFNRSFMNEGDNIKDHLNELLELKTSLDDTEFAVSDGDFVLRILESLPSSYDSFVMSMRCIPDKTQLTPRFVMDSLLEEADRRERRRRLTDSTKKTSVAFETDDTEEPKKAFKKFNASAFIARREDTKPTSAGLRSGKRLTLPRNHL